MRDEYEALLTELRDNFQIDTDADGEHRLYHVGSWGEEYDDPGWMVRVFDKDATARDVLRAALHCIDVREEDNEREGDRR